jgi:hypothetical protein
MALWSMDLQQRQLQVEHEIPAPAVLAHMQLLGFHRGLIEKLGGNPNVPLYGIGAPRSD